MEAVEERVSTFMQAFALRGPSQEIMRWCWKWWITNP